MAVDLTYSCLNEADQSYALTVNFYFDCGSLIIQQPTSGIFVDVFSSSFGETLSIELVRDISIEGEEVSQLCESILDNDESNCQSGNFPGVKKYVFEGIVTLPQKCPDWVFAYRLHDLAFRSQTITNLLSPELQKIYVEATLDNTQGCNSSPTFTSIPVAYYCTQSSTFTQGVIETNGNQLVFTLVQPLDNLNSPIPYANGDTPENPFPNNAFSFDKQTGEIQFETHLAQFPVVAVLVEEYQDGKVVGSVMRDMQFVILDCENESLESNLIPEQNKFTVCVGENLHLDFGFEDFNTEDEIQVIASNIADFNGANFSQSNDTFNPAMASFDWTPSLAAEGFYILEIEANDNHCPIPSKLSYTYNIEVISSPTCATNINSHSEIPTKFFPNPFADFLQIDFSNTHEGLSQIAFYDMKGMLIYQETFNSNFDTQSISTIDWKQGLYLCKITHKEGTFVEKVLKW